MNRTRILEQVARLACRRHRLVVIGALVLTGLSWLPVIFHPAHFAFNISRIIPQDIPATRAFTRVLTDFNTVDEAIVVFHLHETSEANIARVGHAAERAATALRRDERIASAFCRKFTEREARFVRETLIPEAGLLLLPEEELDRVAELLAPERIRLSVARAARRMAHPLAGEEVERLAALDALGLSPVFRSALDRFRPSVQAESETYIVSPDRSMMLLVAQPKEPAQQVTFAQEISDLVRRETEAALAAELTGRARKMVSVEYAGGYEIASRYTHRLNEVMVTTLLTSLVGVILLFGYCFRRWGVLLYVGLPLLMVVSWTVGIGYLVLGQLNIVSCAFAAVLVGLGVDYAIHVYNRYVEERASGADVETSFRVSLASTGWGVFIGMVTTCMAFLALKATRFTQLSEFGFLAGVGIALSVPAMLFVLPALITWMNRLRGEHVRILRPTRFHLPALANLLDRRRRIVLAGGLLLLVGAAATVWLRPGLPRFDERLSTLRPKERAFALSGEIARAFSDRNPNKLMLVIQAASEPAALERAAELQARAERLTRYGPGGTPPLLIDQQSVMELLPAPSAQRARLARLAAIDWEAAIAAFDAAIGAEGLYPEDFALSRSLLTEHARRVREGDLLLASDLRDTPLWRFVRRFVARHKEEYTLAEALPPAEAFPVTLAKPARARETGETVRPAGAVLGREEVAALVGRVKRITIEGSGWTVKNYVYPPVTPGSAAGDVQVDDAWLAAVRARLGLGEDAFITGLGVLAHELATVVREDLLRVSVVVLVVSCVVLLAFFHRHPARVVYALLPVLLGIVYLLGIMAALDLPFNFVNVLAVPIIIGLGVDNGIHLACRFFESARRIPPMVEDTGRAIIITTLTSMIGFGSLMIGGYEGIATMGRLVILALACNLFASLFVYPAILATVAPASRRPADPEQDRD